MTRLVPFGSKPLEIEITARFQVLSNSIEIEFCIDDPKHTILDPLSPGQFSGNELSRADGLWQTTCFEAFWGTPGDSRYWELNLSAATLHWNLYRFDSYRLPTPAEPSHDFKLKSLTRTQQTLLCQLEAAPPNHLSDLQKSLCAVIRTQKQTVYFSEQHAGPKPDFHNRSAWPSSQK